MANPAATRLSPHHIDLPFWCEEVVAKCAENLDLPTPCLDIKAIIDETRNNELFPPIAIEVNTTADNACIPITSVLPCAAIGVVGNPFIGKEVAIYIATYHFAPPIAIEITHHLPQSQFVGSGTWILQHFNFFYFVINITFEDLKIWPQTRAQKKIG